MNLQVVRYFLERLLVVVLLVTLVANGLFAVLKIQLGEIGLVVALRLEFLCLARSLRLVALIASEHKLFEIFA